jgi:nitrogen regulatory protein P-II 2
MKMVIAIIKPFKLDDVKDALMSMGVEGMTVTEVKGYGRQKGQVDISAGPDYEVSFLPKLKLEIAIPTKMEKKVVDVIAESANTGRIGDGKIFVYDLNTAVRIRTGETGDDAV